MNDMTDAGDSTPSEPETGQPPYVIEGARSGRSRCKLCRKTIDKGALRLGTLIEGPYGVGYVWEHLTCAARRAFPKLEEAYAQSAWENAKQPPEDLPKLEDLALLRKAAEHKKTERRELPYAELAPSGRSRCKHSFERILQGAPRVVLAREVSFGNQVRTSPINVLPPYVREALAAEDSGTPLEGFAEALKTNSRGVWADLSSLENFNFSWVPAESLGRSYRLPSQRQWPRCVHQL